MLYCSNRRFGTSMYNQQRAGIFFQTVNFFAQSRVKIFKDGCNIMMLPQLVFNLGYQNLFMKILLFFLCCCMIEFSFAANTPLRALEDSSIKKAPYELSQNEFLQQYGRDDSSKALIDFFFHRRMPGITEFAVGMPLLIAGGIGIGAVNHTANEGNGTWDTVGQGLIFALLLGAGIALSIVGICMWSRYPRKRLLRLLNNYFGGKPLPRGITKNRTFKSFVQHER